MKSIWKGFLFRTIDKITTELKKMNPAEEEAAEKAAGESDEVDANQD